MTELPVGTGAESLYVCITRTCIENRFEINRKHILMADLIVVHFLLSGEPDYFGRKKISSGGDLSHYSSASLY